MSYADRGIYEGATEPTYYGERKVWSVTGLTLGVRSRIVDLPLLWVEGEISDLRVPRPGQRFSTCFFTLKDPKNGFMLSCTMPHARYNALKLNLRDGDLVQCSGRPDIYAARGTFQLRVQSMEHSGRGLLLQQLEALAAKLEAEGLFAEERKQALPFLPRRIGVITGAAAAAQGDFLRNVYERFPPAKLVMIETLVQGDRAAPQIVAALNKLDQVSDVDVIVVTRGGGAFEDFLPFSDERVCRAIAACSKPVVSAIGHEKDSPIADHVADLRVSTPTAAARTVVPDYAEIVHRLDTSHRAVRRRSVDHVRRREEHLLMLRSRLTDRSPARFVAERIRWISSLNERAIMLMQRRLELSEQKLTQLKRDMHRAVEQNLDRRNSNLAALFSQLRALSPRAVLDRGFAIVRRASNQSVLTAASEIQAGEQLDVILAQGKVSVEVVEQPELIRSGNG